MEGNKVKVKKYLTAKTQRTLRKSAKNHLNKLWTGGHSSGDAESSQRKA